MPRSRRSALRTLAAATSIAASIALITASQTFAHWDQPSYRADVAPGTLAAGTASTVTLTVTQVGHDSSQFVRSLRITPPASFDLTGGSGVRGSTALTVAIASDVATIDHVGLDYDEGETQAETAVITLQVNVACGVVGDKVWTVVARNSETFGGSGHDVAQVTTSQLTTQVKRCSLAFATQPKSAAVNAVITNAVADPSGPKVKVQLLDGNGANASQSGIGVSLAITSGTGVSSASLGGGTTDSTNSDGVAMFSPTIDRTGQNYRLVASATTSGIGSSDDSATFDISDVAVVCSGSCSGSSQQGDTGATVSADSNGGVLAFSIGIDNVDCNNSANKFYEGSSQALTFSVTGGTSRTLIVMKLDKISVTKSFLKYDVCFSSPNSSFTNKFGKAIAAGDAGLLPFCLNPLRNRADPCVVLKWFDRQGNVLLKFSVPAGDPRAKI